MNPKTYKSASVADRLRAMGVALPTMAEAMRTAFGPSPAEVEELRKRVRRSRKARRRRECRGPWKGIATVRTRAMLAKLGEAKAVQS